MMITPEDLRRVPLFRNLEESEIKKLALAAGDIHLLVGEWLTQEGDVPAFYVILSGTLELSKTFGSNDLFLTQLEAGDYIGEIPLLLGSNFIANLRAATEVRVARLSGDVFFDLVMRSEKTAAHILQTMSRRVNGVRERSVAVPQQHITVFGQSADRDCYNLRQFLSGNGLSFQWQSIDDPEAVSNVPQEALTGPYPFVMYPNGASSRAPTHREVAECTGLQTVPKNECYDVVIIGGGPSGLAAAVYGASEGLTSLILERQAPGGQAGTSSRIENYLGFPNGLSGSDLANRALQQAKRFGAEVVVTRAAHAIHWSPDSSAVVLDDGTTVRARSMILAMGVAWRTLNVPNVEELVGKGIYYGAARTEAANARGKDVYLVGGGNSAGQAAMFFADYARSVTLLIRSDDIASNMSEYLIKQLKTKSNISVCVNCRVVEVHGTTHLEAITVETSSSDPAIAPTRRLHPTNALFTFIGAEAATDWLPDQICRDELGFILTGRSAQSHENWPLDRAPYFLETTVPGIFAAGDVRHNSVKRVAASVGEGSMSIAFVHQYLAAKREHPG
jgi:thioredoxin reductase (NADPH)